MRGAGRQYDRPWGIDLSTWRTAADSATSFDAAGTQTGGWSPSYLLRHMYAAYMAGAHILQIEPTLYYLPGGSTPNPFGLAVKRFADFALRRHPDVGSPVVPMALMLDAHSGFDTKHGPYNQQNAVWYQDIAYSAGDFMIDNFLKLAYPNHWRHGTLSGAPFSTPAGYQAFLASGRDPRPYEPMPFTRWGDTFDVTLNTATSTSLRRYKVIALTGDVLIDARLRQILTSWVEAGGTLVVNVRQATGADEALLGVRLGGAHVRGTTSRWLSDDTQYPEAPFSYKPVALVSARALATTGDGAPLITSNPVGAGRVILTTPGLSADDRVRSPPGSRRSAVRPPAPRARARRRVRSRRSVHVLERARQGHHHDHQQLGLGLERGDHREHTRRGHRGSRVYRRHHRGLCAGRVNA